MERKSLLKCSLGFIFAISLLVFSPQIVYAQTDDLSRPSILPDSIFYGLKLAIENVREAFTFQDDRLAELILKHSEERDREAQELERQGKEIPLQKLREIQARKLMKAEEIIAKLENIEMQKQLRDESRDMRNELMQAGSERDAIVIQQQQRIRDEVPTLIEPSTRPKLIEGGELPKRSDQPLIIKDIAPIRENDPSSTILTKLKDRLQNAFTTSEISEIRAKFSELRAEDDPVRKEMLAKNLDDKVNNPVISITCLGRVNTLSLSLAVEPVKELQEQCPLLRPLPANALLKLANSVD